MLKTEPDPASPESLDDPSKKVWRHGSLIYTPLALGALLFWLLLADVAWSLRERSVPNVMQLMFQKFGASNLLSSLLISFLPNVLVLFCSPIVSYRSDRHRSRMGRRIPFLLWHIPVAVVSLFAVALSPRLGGSLNTLLGSVSPNESTCTLIVVAAGWSLFELATVVATAVFYGLINDVVPTGMLGRFYGMFRGISLGASIFFNYYLFGRAERQFPLIFMGIGVVYGIGFSVMCWKVKEGEYPPPKPIEDGRGGLVAGLRLYFRNCLSHPYYVWVFAALATPWVAFIAVNHFSVYFAKSLSMDMAVYGKCLALTYTVSLVLSYPLGMLADRFHPLRTSLVALALYAGVTLGGAIFATNPPAFSVFFVLHGVLSGAWMTSSASLPLRMFPRSSFSQYYSALYLAIGLGMMTAGPSIGRALDLTHRFYRLTFMTSCGLAILALVLGLIVHAKFMKLGGPKDYIAPE